MIRRALLKAAALGLGAGLAAVFAAGAALLYFSLSLPRLATLDDYRPPIPSVILSRDGAVLARIGREEREVVPFGEVPKTAVDAFLSAEDDAFFRHDGVDYLGIARAMVANIRAGRVVQGGSTITQQVAKSMLLDNKRSIARKIKDFLLAKRIEERFSKEDILYLYLNQVYLGGGYYGVKAAVRGYFGKELDELTVAEAAMVAGLLVAPGRYSPYRNPQAAVARQRYVLRRMLEVGKISEEAHAEAVAEEVRFRKKAQEPFRAGHFTDWIRQRALRALGEEELLTGGYVVRTTLDWGLQRAAEAAVARGVRAIDRRQGFKGALSNVPGDEWEDFLTKEREAAYEEASAHFTIVDGKAVDEFEMGGTEAEDLRAHREREAARIGSRRFPPGIMGGDPLAGLVGGGGGGGGGRLRKALVTGTDDGGRIIHVSVAGVPGIIPFDGFKWAHERHVSEERRTFPDVTRPSSIVKRGDVVLVSVRRRPVGLAAHGTAGLKRAIGRHRRRAVIRRQRYLLCALEQEPEAEGALVALSPFTGDILAMVGGADFERSQFNRAVQSKRQPGSAFKPILYAAALERGYGPDTVIIDSPESLEGADQGPNWKPRNYDGRFKGPMTFRSALEVSRNIPTIKIAQDVGLAGITEFTRRIGLPVDMAPDLSFALGSLGVTLLDLTAAYGVFPNGGRRVAPRAVASVSDRDGDEAPLDDGGGGGGGETGANAVW